MMDGLRDHLEAELIGRDFRNIQITDNKIKCDCMVEEYLIGLKCILPPDFPYKFPKIYIEEECYEQIRPLPHVDSTAFVCVVDSEVAVPNFIAPSRIIIDTLVLAKQVIEKGICGENRQDFIDEFCSYWIQECEFCAESIIVNTDKAQAITCFRDGKKVYCASSKEELDAYLSNIGIKKRYVRNYHDGIYLPLNIDLFPPYPQSNLEFYKFILSDTDNSEMYKNYLKKRIPYGGYVAFSLPTEKRRQVQLFFHTQISGKINGFRNRHIPVGVAYQLDKKKEPVVKFMVEDLSQERLFIRGGAGGTTQISRVAIIGCGSVGSYIIEALSEYGIASYVLVDNDILSASNIARHYCGYEYIGKKKVDAIKAKLHKENPNIHVEAFHENGLAFISNRLDILNSCDSVFVATAAVPLEHRILEFVNNGSIVKPVILTWVEPLLAAGHAIIVNRHQDIFGELFDESFDFSEKVLINGAEYASKEAGCHSTYFPYAAFALKRFIYTFLEYYFNENLIRKKTGNYMVTWCGNLSSIEKSGGRISPRWSKCDNFSFHIKRID